jgi:hypothetical protein
MIQNRSQREKPILTQQSSDHYTVLSLANIYDAISIINPASPRDINNNILPLPSPP